jgi:parallel beta-helix repeat protein
MTTLTPTPKQQFLDANGNPLAGGKVYTYAAGTTTPLVTYTDEGGSTPNTNPVILDSRGEAAIWLGVASYKLKLTTSTDVEIWTVDNIVSASVQALANLSESGGSALVGFLQSGTGAVATTVQAKLRETVSVKDFGAVGDGVTDDTVAINAAISSLSSNAELVFPAKFNFAITSLLVSGKSNFAIRIDGKITNISAKAGATATNVNTTQGGIYPTFGIYNCSKFRIYGSGQINPGYREAFWIGEIISTGANAACTDFDISVDVIGNSTNDNIHANRLRYCSRFTFRDMKLDSVTKKPTWVNAATAYYYSWCEALLLWDCADFTIKGVTSKNNAMNGIYVGSNCDGFTLTDNDLQHNGGSGVQLAWSSFGNFPRNFNIIGNRARFNRADGYDLNNTGTLLDCNGTLVGNLSYYNGWGTEDTAGTAPTNDGSGIGTFINVKKITVADNVDVECSRTGVYCSVCYDFSISGNIINKSAAASLGEGLYFDTCTNIDAGRGNNVNVLATKAAMKIFSATANLNVKVVGNYFSGLVQFAGGTYVDCKFNENRVLTTTGITMPVNACENTIVVSGASQNGLSAGASGVVLERNRVSSTNYGIVSSSFNYVTILNNDVTGGLGGIYVATNTYTRVSGNYASGQGSPGVHFDGVCDNCELSMNRASSVTGNSFRVESTCTNTNKWSNKVILGPASFAGTYGINY